MKENSKSAQDTDVTIRLNVNKTTLSRWDPFATEDGISSIETNFADLKMTFFYADCNFFRFQSIFMFVSY